MKKSFLPILTLALMASPAAVHANDDGDAIVTLGETSTTVPETFVKTSGNLFGTKPGTAPEGWTLSFPNADASLYDELAAGVRTTDINNSMPQMEGSVFSSSAKAVTRLEITVPLANFGIDENLLEAYAQEGKNLSLYFSCDAATSYTTLGQDKNPSVKFNATLLRADKSAAGNSEARAYLNVYSATSHIFSSAEISTDEAFRPAYVNLAIEMKPCDGMEDIADEGVSVGNVHIYISADDLVTKDIMVDCNYPGTLIGEGRYLSLGNGQKGSMAYIVFDSANRFTRALLKDLDGNVLATCDNKGDNIARLPIAVNQELKTDYELTGEPTDPDYDPEDDEDNPDDGTTTLTLELEGTTPTAINGVKTDGTTANPTTPKHVYNISGQKVNTTQAGQMYIVGGKKTVVK